MKPHKLNSPLPLRFIRQIYQLCFKTSLFTGLLLALAVAGFTQSAPTTAGDLDPTFGHRGRMLSDFGDGNDSNDFAYAMALQPDGKIVVAGDRYFGNNSEGADMLVARYNTNGTLDKTFGSGGKVTTDFGLTEFAQAVVIQPDGKIVVAGVTTILFPVFGDFALARYNPDGSLDSSFGSGGLVTSFFGGQGCAANALALQADGKIIAAGEKTIDFIFGDMSDIDFAVARYNTDGSLDTTFGQGGVATTDYFQLSDSAAAVLVQPEGKIVAVGTSEGLSTFRDFAVVRYLPNGAPDTSFGQQGKVFTDLHAQDGEGASAAVLQPDGKIVAGGSAFIASGKDPFVLIRYNPNGKVDRTFGRNGVVGVSFGRFLQSVGALALQTDGKIVAAGFSSSEGSSDDFLIARILATGQLDSTFGTGGKVTTNFGDLNGGAFATAVQRDGKIVAAGFQATKIEGVDVALARYLGK